MDEVYDIGEFMERIIERPADNTVLEIYFEDLKEETQDEVLKYYGIHEPEEMNWDTEPIVILERPEPEDER